MKHTILPLLGLLALVFFTGCKSFNLPYDQDLRLTQLNAQTVPAASGITVRFNQTDKQVSGKAGCNGYSAPYTLKGSKLSFGTVNATKMTCPNQEWEDKFLAALAQVDEVRQVGNRYHLLGAGKTVAVLAQ